MALRRAVLNGSELLHDFEVAALERLRNARTLLAAGQGTGATYLAGYAAEMHLKQALFRFDGARAFDLVKPRLAPARRWAKAALPGYEFRNSHDILGWALALRRKRVDRGRPLPQPVAQNMVRLATRLDGRWSENLRYHSNEVGIVDARSVVEDVAWFEKHRAELWR